LGVIAFVTVLPALLVSGFAKQGYMGTFFVEQPTDAMVKLVQFDQGMKSLVL
jgi:hypothetical protein